MGRVYKCPVCGFQTEYPIDRGLMTGTEAAGERETILAGYYGPKAKAALIAHPEATVEVEHALIQCGACGKLESRLAVTLKAPEQVRILQQCDCGKAMHRIRAGKDMVCPECKQPLEVTDLVAVTMWD